MKKFIITVDTNWYGTSKSYGAIAVSEEKLWDITDDLAYENFLESDGFNLVLSELYPEAEEYTSEMEEHASNESSDYYTSNIEEYDSDIHGNFEDYDIVYDESISETSDNSNSTLQDYNIYAGLGGGFGGATYIETIEDSTLQEAEEYAYECACQEYEDAVGLHGIRTIVDIMEQDGLDEEEAVEIFEQERESWIDYCVIPTAEDDNNPS